MKRRTKNFKKGIHNAKIIRLNVESRPQRMIATTKRRDQQKRSSQSTISLLSFSQVLRNREGKIAHSSIQKTQCWAVPLSLNPQLTTLQLFFLSSFLVSLIDSLLPLDRLVPRLKIRRICCRPLSSVPGTLELLSGLFQVKFVINDRAAVQRAGPASSRPDALSVCRKVTMEMGPPLSNLTSRGAKATISVGLAALVRPVPTMGSTKVNALCPTRDALERTTWPVTRKAQVPSA